MIAVAVGVPVDEGALSGCFLTRVTRVALSTCGHAKKQIPMCSLRALTFLPVRDLPWQGMVGPTSDSRLTKPRREDEASGPPGQRPARASRRGPSWTEFVTRADQAVVAIAGTDMKNRVERRACGYSRGSRRLDTEPETERTAGPASNAAGDGRGRAQEDQAGFEPYWKTRRTE